MILMVLGCSLALYITNWKGTMTLDLEVWKEKFTQSIRIFLEELISAKLFICLAKKSMNF